MRRRRGAAPRAAGAYAVIDLIFMDATTLELPLDPLQRARYFRDRAEEFRQEAESATLSSVRESYLKMAHTNDIMADAAEAELLTFARAPESSSGDQ
jgi:hypothetical protein